MKSHLKSITFGIIATTLIATTAIARTHTHTGTITKHHHRYARTNHDPGTSVPVIPAPIDLGTSEDGFKPEIADWSYSETPPAKKLADVVFDAFDGVPEGSPKVEIGRVAAAFGLDPGLMFAICHIESDFNPRERTGSYTGLYQLSRTEFKRYGPTGGDILDARDNAIAAAAKLEDEEALFKLDTRHVPTDADLYLIHQQGLQGAAEHLAHPEQAAWLSMCQTDEGRQKGQGWCRKAIWLNTLPAFKHLFKSVENFTSGEFVRMWATRLASFLGHPTTFAAAGDADNAVEEKADGHPKRHRAKHFAHAHHHVRVAHHHRLHYYIVRA